MGFLFFGKKKKEVDEAVEHINTISQNLKTSFIRVKADIKVVRDWLSFFKDKDGEYQERFDNVESRMQEMSEVIAYLAERDQVSSQAPKTAQKTQGNQQYYQYEEKIAPATPQRSILDDLTETQRAIFLRLGVFQRESGQEWTSLKGIAQDIYPHKSYDKVRSTLSEYVGILIDCGLLRKTRKGKQTYISITEKGQQYIPKTPLKKVVKKPLLKKQTENDTA